MLKMSRIAVVLAALLLVSAAPALAAGHAKTVPFHGAVLAEGPEPDMNAPGCDPGAIWRFSRAGAGDMLHLGDAEAVLSHCTYVVPDGSAFHALVLGGMITFTAANGDTLVLAYEGTTDGIVDATGGFLGYTAEGTWTVAGGTGRFANATGSGSLDVVGDVPGGDGLFGLPDGFDQWTFEGRIAYDASDRSK